MLALQVKTELEAMTDLYQDRQPARVLEIGVWQGGTLQVWLEQGHPETVVAVDLDHPNAASYPDWTGDHTDLRVFVGSSTSPEGKDFIQRNAPYDWAFIDGDHGPLGVTIDVETVLPLVRPDGLLLLHDISPPPDMDTYQPLIEFRKLAETHDTWTFIADEPVPNAHGIGVVQMPAAK